LPEIITTAQVWQSPRPLQLRNLKKWGYILKLFRIAAFRMVSPGSALIVLFCFINLSSSMPQFP